MHVKSNKPCFGETSTKKLAKISLSDSTIKTSIDKLAMIFNIVLQKVQALPFFTIQCNEMTDAVHTSQLLVYVRFVGSTTIEEKMLFCRTLEMTTKAEDVLKVVDAYFHEKDMNWMKLVDVCTDGARAMLGCRSGFVARIKQKNLDVVGTHCIIHPEALVSRTLPMAMQNKPAIIICIVNCINASAANSLAVCQAV